MFSGGNYLWGNFPGGIIRGNYPGQFSSGAIIWRGNFPRGQRTIYDNFFYLDKTVRTGFTLGSHVRVSPHLRGIPPKGPTLGFWVPLLRNVCNFIKREALPMVISCEFREVSKNTISYRTPPMATPGPKKVQ